MRNRVVLVSHNPPFDHDRASDQLLRLGFEIDWRYPFRGDVLGDLTNDIAGTVVLGGMYSIDMIPEHAFLQDEIRWLKQCMDAGLPTLGICQGGQMIAHILGAEVGPHPEGLHEYGYYRIDPTEDAEGFLNAPLWVPQAHFHQFDLPKGATLLANSDTYPHQAFQWGDKVFGFQFHPEASQQLIRESWLDQPWSDENSRQPNAQSREEIERLGAEQEAEVDRWFRGFLTGLFGTAGGKA